MQTKEAIAKLCGPCQVNMTTQTLEAKTTKGGVVSFPCCISCRPKVEIALRNARAEMLGEEDEDDILEQDMLKINTKKLDSVIADKHARQHQSVDGREHYVDAGTVHPSHQHNKVAKAYKMRQNNGLLGEQAAAPKVDLRAALAVLLNAAKGVNV